MKIPTILAEASLPAVQLPRASVSGGISRLAAPGAVDTGQGLYHVGQALAHIADVQAAKDEQFAKDEAGTAAARFELASKTFDASLRTTTRDPDEYLKALNDSTKQMAEDEMKSLRSERGKQLYQQTIRGALVDLQVGGVKHANALYLDRGKALLDETLDQKRKSASMTPLDDPTQVARHYRDGLTAIQNSVPLIGEQVAGDLRRKFRQSILFDRADQEIQANPSANVLSKYQSDLEPSSVEILGRRQEAAQRRIVQDQDRAQAKVEKDAETTRQLMLTTLTLKATQGALTESDLERAVRERVIIHPGEVDHLRTLIVSPRETPSDPELLRRLYGDVYTESPRTTVDQIRRYMDDHAAGRPGLNPKDGLAAINRLREQSERLQDQGHARAAESYRLAKEEGYKRLGLTTPFDQLDPKAKKLVADFDAAFNARMLDKNGNYIAPARDTLYEILPRFVEAQRADAKLDYTTQRKLMESRWSDAPADPMDPAFLAWYGDSLRRLETIREAEPNIYARQKAALQQLRDARKIVIDQAVRTANPPSAGSSRPGMPASQRPLTTR